MGNGLIVSISYKLTIYSMIIIVYINSLTLGTRPW